MSFEFGLLHLRWGMGVSKSPFFPFKIKEFTQFMPFKVKNKLLLYKYGYKYNSYRIIKLLMQVYKLKRETNIIPSQKCYKHRDRER